MSDSLRDHLVTYLSDAYWIERRALAHLGEAPETSGDGRLADVFGEHLLETERHVDLAGERLEALGGSPSEVERAAADPRDGDTLLLSRVQPDTPGKLVAHAHSYEALEWAAWELVRRMADRADDPETAQLARSIRDEHRGMQENLARCFDDAAAAALAAVGEDRVGSHLLHHLQDAYGLEKLSCRLLEKSGDLVDDAGLDRICRAHLQESRSHARWVDERRRFLGGGRSTQKDRALGGGSLQWTAFFRVQGDTAAKLAAILYGFENLEIAGYELLRRVALAAGDTSTVRVADRILSEERAMAQRVAASFGRALDASLATEGVAAE